MASLAAPDAQHAPGDHGSSVTDVGDVLDLRSTAPGEYWNRIMDAVHRLDRRADAWSLHVFVADTPDVAAELPHLVAYLDVVGLPHDVTRDSSGAQVLRVSRHS
jgi:hypothetical protein